MMHMDMQERRPRNLNAFSEGLLDMLEIIEPRAVQHVYDEMRSGETDAIALTKVVLPILIA
jgi:hypothetical protein